jgi:hypothetical protein
MLGLPVVGFAQDPSPQPQQQPQPTQPQPTQPQPAQPQPAQPAPQPAQPQPAQPQPQQPASPAPTPQPAQAAQAVSPQEHLSQAKAAAESITTTAVPAKSRSQLAQLKKHISALEKAGPATSSATPAPAAAAKSNSNWGTEVAAIDKIITEMLGSETATGATATPGAAGTTGKAAAAIAIDDATRAKLMDIRTHITAYAAGMSGTATPKTDAPAPSPEPAAAATPAEQPSATPSAPAPSPAATAPSPAAQSPAPTAAEAAPAAAAQPQAAAAQPQIDADGARRSLVAARESLTQLTKLPAAAQLTGDARTQVGQLIANFNELISAQTNWRASYTKVAANLTALLGSDSADAAAAPAPAATPGAVGTAGSTKVELDPSIREKLMELRKNLAEFEKASGGAEVK